MILDKEVEIRITNFILNRYKNLGYDVKIGDVAKININDVSAKSHVKINCQCDFCDNKTHIEYRNYFIVLNRNDNKYMCKECGKIKNNKILKEKFKNQKWVTDRTEKTRFIKNEKYGDSGYSNREKYVNTMNSIYGVDNPSQLDDIKKKKTDTFMKNYGVKHYFLTDECKDIINNKYGTLNIAHIPCVFDKSQKTAMKFQYYNDVCYQGTYKLDFLQKYFDKLKIEKPKYIKYVFKKENKMHHPDFYIPELNLIVEIKSSYWYNKYLGKNRAKMKYTKASGYDMIFIINKNYKTFDKMLKEKLNIYNYE